MIVQCHSVPAGPDERREPSLRTRTYANRTRSAYGECYLKRRSLGCGAFVLLR